MWRADAFTFSPLSIPFIVLCIGLLVMIFTTVLTRGNALIRVAILAVGVFALPWATGNALAGSCTDPVVAASICRFWVGTVSLLGPAFLMLILVYSGRFERHVTLIVIATICAASTCVVTWTTDLVIAEAWQTSWGFWTPKGGPLNDLQPGQLVLWSLVGIVLVRRGRDPSIESARQQFHVKRMMAIVVLAVLGASDGLLAHGIGVFPLSVVPGAATVVMALVAIFKHDVLHSRGFDRVAAWELVVLAAFSAVVVAIVWGMLGRGYVSPIVTAAVIAPLFAIGQFTVLVVRDRLMRGEAGVGSAADLALERYVDDSGHFGDEAQMVEELGEMLTGHTRVTAVRLFVADAAGRWHDVHAAAGAPPVVIDARVRAWLVANRAPIQREELPTQRLGGLRLPIEKFLALIGAEIVVPLVDRDELVGAILANAPAERALSDAESVLLSAAARATANALAYIHLLREAEERVEVAREVEVAAAAQNARSPGETHVKYTQCEVITHYQPAAQFGGDWWASAELPDGRVVVAIGDVTGHGVPAALVSSTVVGACETAHQWWGGGLDALAMLQLLNETVLNVGGEQYAMTCFVAVFDVEHDRVTFANAGHPFPYVCRRKPGGNGKAVLSALVSRGTPLGTENPVLSTSTAALERDDVVVFYSDALVDSRNVEGLPYGERRFQRLLRNYVRSAGARACEVIVEDARGHCGDRPIDDDVTLVVVRLGVS